MINYLIDSTFKNIGNRTWKLDNIIKWENNNKRLLIESEEKLFGINQPFRASKGRYYFRADIQLFKFAKEIIIGYKKEKELYMNYTTPFVSNNKISTIFEIEEECEIDLYIIIKSNTLKNKAMIKEPILIKLDDIEKTTWLKDKLDEEIKYKESITYYNELFREHLKNNWKTKDKISIKDNITAVVFDKNKLERKIKINTEDKYLFRIEYKSNNAYAKMKVMIGNKEYKLKTGKGKARKDIYFDSREREINIAIEFMNDEITPDLPAIFIVEDIMLINLTKHKIINKRLDYIPYV